MQPFLILIYLILCMIVGFLGHNRRFGYAGTVTLAILLTPFLVFLGLVLFERRPQA